MTYYYERHSFSSAQARHATEVVGQLMKNRRFFLHDNRNRGGDPDYTLNPLVFADAIELDENVRGAYRKARKLAEERIFATEQRLGFAKPDLSGNKQVVECKRYTGGFDICRVYPITAFTDTIPQIQEALSAQQFKRMMNGRTRDDVSPKTIRSYKDQAEQLAATIWSQFEAFDAHNPDNHRCLMLLESRINVDGCSDIGDFADNRLLDLQDYPHAVGYLFHRYCTRRRIVRHNYVVSSTSRKSHVRFEHWAGEKSPVIFYDATAGYSCPVAFATIL